MTDSGISVTHREAFQKSLKIGDICSAMQTARLLLRTDQGSSTCSFIRKSVAESVRQPSGLHPLRVGILSSFSSEFVHDPLVSYAFADGIHVEIYQAGFGQYRQEILDPASGLYAWKPEVVILAVEGEDWAPVLYHRYLDVHEQAIDALVHEPQTTMENLIRTFRSRSSAVVLVHNLFPPVWRSLGILDGHRGHGQGAIVNSLNDSLCELSRKVSGVYVVDYAGLVAQFGAANWYDLRMSHYAKAPIARPMLGNLAREYLRFFRALTGKSKKCLVVDLDNTLWGGVVGEDGAHGVKLGESYPGSAYREFQREVLNLKKRGVILAVASKNNEIDVETLFATNNEMVLKKQDFSAWKVNWNLKSQSIMEIAKELNIGLEHVVFADDSHVECDQVSSALPMVTVIPLPKQPERYREALLEEGLFDTLNISQEDKRRGELYRQRDEAETLRAESKTLEDFYQGLEMVMTFAPVHKGSLARAAQLTQKTNQFNLTTIRYSEAELSLRMADAHWILTTVQVRDRFGDNGIVGLMIVRKSINQLEIDTFLLSCRVIGRTVETAMLAYLVQHAITYRIPEIAGRFVPTAKNLPAKDLYERHGFHKLSGMDNTETLWVFRIGDRPVVCPNWIKIIEADPAEV